LPLSLSLSPDVLGLFARPGDELAHFVSSNCGETADLLARSIQQFLGTLGGRTLSLRI
jgi:hypothetical protein